MVPEPPKYSYDPNSASRVFDRPASLSDRRWALVILLIILSVIGFVVYLFMR